LTGKIRRSFVLVPLLACIGAVANSPARVVQQRFIDAVTAGWESYEVCEHHSRAASREAFFGKALGIVPAAALKVRESKELTVREAGAGRALHLGIADIELPTPELASRVHRQPRSGGERFLADTKILTRYVTSRQERRVLVVYSETHLQPAVQRFLRELEAQPDQLWERR